MSGAGSTAALEAYEAALAAFVGWRGGVDAALDTALGEAPAFVMPHLLRAWHLVCGRDPARIARARAVFERVLPLPANEREHQHLAALGALLRDDYEGAKARLGALLEAHPRDVLALHAAHSLDYGTGDVAQLLARPARVLRHWSPALPGYAAVQAMLAFGEVEAGDPARARRLAEEVLAQDAQDPRAHHVMAHVLETAGRADDGVTWMHGRIDDHAADRQFSVHTWWHLALFHLGAGEPAEALRLYDRRVRATASAEVADLIDAASLLWRLELAGGEPGARWHALAAAWAHHAEDAFCSFSDVHAMLAFAGAGDEANAQRLLRTLRAAAGRPTRHGETTRQLGEPACRALHAFARGDAALASTLLARLPALAHRLGGSHAQRDVLYLTWLHAIERVRRPMRGTASRGAAPPGPALALAA
ncbi:MAG: tetratricopeptide repeat protein [Rubrivivax sp.]|nr:tetratricopeptide repeat protein [Rubrivivax sp.]